MKTILTVEVMEKKEDLKEDASERITRISRDLEAWIRDLQPTLHKMNYLMINWHLQFAGLSSSIVVQQSRWSWPNDSQ